jgi:hypothetical protein
MRMRLLATSLLVCLAASACKNDEAAKPAADKAPAAEKPPAPPPAKLAPDFSAWDSAGKKKAWVGSWVVKDNGSFQAWTVGADGKVQVREGDKDSSYMLEVEIPCYAYFATDSGMKYPHPFTVTADGKLRSSGVGGGYRKGAEAIFCDASSTVYVLGADGKCVAWKDEIEWTKSDAECSLGKDAEGKDVFKHGEPNGGEFVIEGDAIIGGKYPSEPAADHEAAKTAAAAKNAAP